MSLLKPWLFLPPQLAHDLSPFVLPLAAQFSGNSNHQWHSFEWKNLHFRNPIGIAGGLNQYVAFDNNLEQAASWWKLGAGFIEVGTITPQAQGPNPGKIMDRNLKQEALWNKMGFPNKGLDLAFKQLQKLNHQNIGPIFANIGKNRNTDNEDSAKD